MKQTVRSMLKKERKGRKCREKEGKERLYMSSMHKGGNILQIEETNTLEEDIIEVIEIARHKTIGT